jgi:hypothetical protein
MWGEVENKQKYNKEHSLICTPSFIKFTHIIISSCCLLTEKAKNFLYSLMEKSRDVSYFLSQCIGHECLHNISVIASFGILCSLKSYLVENSLSFVAIVEVK